MRMVLIYLLIPMAQFSFGQILRVEVLDSTLLKIVDITIDTLAVPENELGVITLEISNFNTTESEVEVNDRRLGKVFKKVNTLAYDVKSSFNMNNILLQYEPPACYFFYRGRPVLMYFGPERLFRIEDKEITALQKKLKNYFRRDGGSYASPICWLSVSGNDVTLLRKWKVRWSRPEY